MIIRIIAVDPKPKDPRDDVVVYQVPEKSRAHYLLVEMFNELGIEWTELGPGGGRKRKKKG